MTLPALFVSHGAPNLVLHNTEARRFLEHAMRAWPRPDAIVIVSAHFEGDPIEIVTDPAPEMIYDFRGFEPELHEKVYPAPGAPELAGRIADLLSQAGIDHKVLEFRGYDHGAWVPLSLMFPDADIPVAQVSINPHAGAAAHHALGAALAPLRDDNVLIIGSGSATHNLHEFFNNTYAIDAPAPDWVSTFGDWINDRIEAGDREALLDYRAAAPFAEKNHPTEDHILPLFVALGAGGEGRGRRVHTSREYGILMMDCYAFG